MNDRQKHRWVGWGYDTQICEHCRIDAYDELQVALGYTEYCDEIPSSYQDRQELLAEIKQRKALALKDALDVARHVLSEEQWKLIGISHPYRIKDVIVI